MDWEEGAAKKGEVEVEQMGMVAATAMPMAVVAVAVMVPTGLVMEVAPAAGMAVVAGAVMVAVEKEVAESGPARETPPPPRLLSSRWRWSPALR